MNSFPNEKPQGWQRAQRAKRGLVECYYECGQLFRTEKEARDHMDCPVKKKDDLKYEHVVEKRLGIPKTKIQVYSLNEQYKQGKRLTTADLFFQRSPQ